MSLSQENLAAMLPPALASSLPPRGPSLRERREALRRSLTLRPWVSDRMLADWCGVSRELVQATRARMTAAGEIRPWPDRIGRDGKRYTKFPAPKGPADETSPQAAPRSAAPAPS